LLKRLVERPVLAKCVRRLKLRPWRTLGTFKYQEYKDFDLQRRPEPNLEDYQILTLAAKDAGIIDAICPYEAESNLVREGRARSHKEGDSENYCHREIRLYNLEFEAWAEHMYDPMIPARSIPYDRKFCQLLRAGFDEAYLVLLVAMLPLVRHINIQRVSTNYFSLAWKAPMHRFRTLPTISAGPPHPGNA
jgi:hypothetical protein